MGYDEDGLDDVDSTLLPIDAGPLTVCVQAVPTGMMGVSSDPVGVFVTFTIKVWWCLVFIVCYIYVSSNFSPVRPC